jgi:hypothetical protein
LPQWLRDTSASATTWALQAILALSDASPDVGWRERRRPAPSAAPSAGDRGRRRLAVREFT